MRREIAKAVLGVGGCFCLATGVLFYVTASLSAKLDEGQSLYFPRNVDQLRALANQLTVVKEEHFWHVLLLFTCAYLFKQTFSIPGSVVMGLLFTAVCRLLVPLVLYTGCYMNILAGALFGVKVGLPLVCALTATGASCCYILSHTFGRSLVHRLFARRLKQLQERLNDDQHSLLFLLISLRLFPMSPNWLFNLTSPLLGVPLHLFFVSVLLGLIPYNLLCVQAGLVLSELQMISVLNLRSTLSLLGGAGSLVATAILVRWCKTRNQPKKGKLTL